MTTLSRPEVQAYNSSFTGRASPYGVIIFDLPDPRERLAKLYFEGYRLEGLLAPGGVIVTRYNALLREHCVLVIR